MSISNSILACENALQEEGHLEYNDSFAFPSILTTVSAASAASAVYAASTLVAVSLEYLLASQSIVLFMPSVVRIAL